MLHVRIVCVGKLKEKYFKEAEAEYAKRLKRYCELHISEVKDEQPADESPRSAMKARDAEGKRIMQHLRGYVVACDVKGGTFTSETFSAFLDGIALSGERTVSFVIGGSTGLSEDVLARADMRLSFSRMTMPHRLFRIVLLEQIYRAFRIARGETYHK